MNMIEICGGVCNVRKNEVSSDKVAYNFSIAVDEGSGDNRKTTYFNCTVYAKKGNQEKYYDDIIVKGARLPVSGNMTTGRPYTDKNGSTITPWVVRVQQIGIGINKAAVVGRLTEDVEIRESGDRVILKYTLAVNRPSKDAPADFIKCTQFGRIDGGLAQYASENYRKGSSVAVCGRQQTGSYTDKEGNKRYTQELIVSESMLFGKKKEAGEATGTPMVSSGEETGVPADTTVPSGVSVPDPDGFQPIEGDDEDLPF